MWAIYRRGAVVGRRDAPSRTAAPCTTRAAPSAPPAPPALVSVPRLAPIEATRRRPDSPLRTRPPTPHDHAGTFGVRGGPTAATPRSPPAPAGPGSPVRTAGRTARKAHRRGGGRAEACSPLLARQRTRAYTPATPIEFPIEAPVARQDCSNYARSRRRRPVAASPTRPVTTRARVAGSGTAAVGSGTHSVPVEAVQ